MRQTSWLRATTRTTQRIGSTIEYCSKMLNGSGKELEMKLCERPAAEWEVL